DGLIAVTSEIDGVRLSGYVADPAFSRSNNRMQYLFLNGRHIRDRSLQHALGEAYRGLLLHGRHPIGFLMLQMPAEDVDVNVHPTNLEVRFQDGRQLYRQLLSTLRETFLSMDLTRHVAMSGDQDLEANSRQKDLPSTPRLPLSRPPVTAAGLPEPFGGEARSERGEWAEVFAGKFRVEDPSEQIEAAEIPAEPQRPVVSPLGVQLHQRYLVTENDEGMVVIDQHALHERILYEQLRSRVDEGGLEKQPLLVPEPVEMTADEAAAVLEVADSLAQLSLNVESFGGNTVLVTSYPAMLRRANPAELVRHVADKMLEGAEPPEARDLLDELLHMMACKGAVKAGDPLSVEEVTALLEQRHLCEDAHHCPHGRPTALVFSREELDRRFLRT
ncbi:MAG: DNA mismatch repair endonuclease MutL, partial [Pirellulaceae bacterium]